MTAEWKSWWREPTCWKCLKMRIMNLETNLNVVRRMNACENFCLLVGTKIAVAWLGFSVGPKWKGKKSASFQSPSNRAYMLLCYVMDIYWTVVVRRGLPLKYSSKKSPLDSSSCKQHKPQLIARINRNDKLFLQTNTFGIEHANYEFRYRN